MTASLSTIFLYLPRFFGHFLVVTFKRLNRCKWTRWRGLWVRFVRCKERIQSGTWIETVPFWIRHVNISGSLWVSFTETLVFPSTFHLLCSNIYSLAAGRGLRRFKQLISDSVLFFFSLNTNSSLTKIISEYFGVIF